MSNMNSERVLSVHHWNDTLFSFKCTRDPGLRFENGQFVMIGLQQPNGRPLMRAYSIASPNWEEHLEFFSIKVPDGPLTSQLQHLKEGDEIIISKKPTGTLVLDDLNPGKHLYLLSTGTGLAPFMSVIQDPETYERFEKVILVHGVRYVNEVAYHGFITEHLPQNEFFGEALKEKLIYYPTVTREPFENQGRLTDLILERFTGHGRVVDQLVANRLTEEFVLRQVLGDELAVGHFVHVAHAVHQDHFLEALVGFRVLDDTHERCQASAGAQQVQVLARVQVVEYQGTGRLLADDDLVAFLQVLQLRGQRTVRHLDAEELQVLFPVRRSDGIGAHERTAAFLLQADHHELTVLEAQARVAGALEAEQGVVPVVHTEDTFVVHVAHLMGLLKKDAARARRAVAR